MASIAPPGSSPGELSVIPIRVQAELLSTEDRFAEAVRRSLPHMPASMAQEISQLLTPEAVAVMGGVAAAWAVSHFFGVGAIADAVLLVAGIAAWGGSAVYIGRDLITFVQKASAAKSEADLDEAGKIFASVVVRIGSTAVSALFFRAKPKIYQGPPSALPPAPRSPGKLFYQPTIGSAPLRPPPGAPPGTVVLGITDEFGNITINTRILNQPTTYSHTLLHEKVHRFLTPKFYPLREVRVQIATDGYRKSYVLRYLEEAFAQGYANLRVFGDGFIDALTFPVQNNYVTVAQMAIEVRGHLMGTINVGGILYQVFMVDGPDAVKGLKY